MALRRRQRFWLGLVLLIASAMTLAAAAEGPQKWQWILAGMVPDVLLFLGFVLL